MAGTSWSGVVIISARRGTHGAYRTVATDRLASGDANFAVDVPLPPARWQFRARFQDPGQLVASSPRTVHGTVGAPAPAIVSRLRPIASRAAVTSARARSIVSPSGIIPARPMLIRTLQICGADFLLLRRHAKVLRDGCDVILIHRRFLLFALFAPIGGYVRQQRRLGMLRRHLRGWMREKQIFCQPAFVFRNGSKSFQSLGVHDGQIEAGFRAVIQKY